MYLSNIFKKIEQENLDITALSFADDIDFLVPGKTVENIQKALIKVEDLAIKWDIINNVTFNIKKLKVILFTKKTKIRRNINKFNINIENYVIKFNKKVTRWLEIWLDTELTLKEHYKIRFQKTKQTENKLKAISKSLELFSELVRRVQITVT